MERVVIDTLQWGRLYDLTKRVRDLAPWKWMEEIDVFGVDMPQGGGTIFVSVMGAIDTHYAVAVYPDAVALTALWALHEEKDVVPEHLLEIPAEPIVPG